LVTELADAHRFEVWSVVGSALQGTAIAAMGHADDGLAMVDAATRDYGVLQTPPVFWPSLLHLHALVLGMAGRPAEGLARIDEALDIVRSLPEPQTLAPEMLLIKGQLVLADNADASAAEAWFEQSLRVADQLDAPMLQLRPTTALARIWQADGAT